MSNTLDFGYQFETPSGTFDDFYVTVDATPSDSTGLGPSYTVEAIHGNLGTTIIDGISGNTGQVTNNGTFIYDNAIFTSPQNGLTYNGASGSSSGIDVGGLLFHIGSVDYNLYTYNGTFILIDSTNPGNQTDLTLDYTNAPCFCAGTLIETDRGPVAVEALAIGDNVITADGKAEAIRWIGLRAVAPRFMDPLKVLPIRVAAGALAAGIPSRDLRLSPDHALLVDGILVQAGALVNGVSIVRDTTAPESFTYYHIELADHALILAEGATAETFVDNVDRMGFDNWAEHEALFGTDLEIVEMAYPRAKSARQVPQPIKNRLLALATTTADAIAA